MRSSNILSTRRGRLWTFGALYISEGIPYGFSTTAMVMFMRVEGLSAELTGAFAAAALLPWALKATWAPLVDIIQLRRFGGRKAWILACTAMMIITLVTMAAVDFVANYRILVWMVILNNVFCATQDVAIDSLAVSTLKDDERGTGNGFMFGGQYLGIALGGGGAIFVSGQFGFNVAILFISALLLVALFFVAMFVRDPLCDEQPQTRRVGVWSHFLGTLGEFVRNLYTGFARSGRGPKLGLLLAILPTGAMALGYAFLGSLNVDFGLSSNQIASVSTLNTIAAGVGCVIGGMLGDRFGIRKMLGLTYLLTAIPTILLALSIAKLGLGGIPIQVYFAIVLTHGLLFGGAFALHTAIFMGMTNPLVGATQFTAYMAISNMAIVFANFWQGIGIDRMGYTTVLLVDAAFMLVPLALIPFLRNREA